jgi:hypothetical protein
VNKHRGAFSAADEDTLFVRSRHFRALPTPQPIHRCFIAGGFDCET